MKTEEMRKLNEAINALNRAGMIFMRVVNPQDRESIAEFIQEKERIHNILSDLSER